jgi:hypothetical protein
MHYLQHFWKKPSDASVVKYPADSDPQVVPESYAPKIETVYHGELSHPCSEYRLV